MNVNGKLLFTAKDGNYSVGLNQGHGRQLWISDGTESGTSLLKDIPSTESDLPKQLFVDVNGTLFFDAYDPVHQWALWKTDGTEQGTTLVKDIDLVNPGWLSGGLSANGNVWFVADDGIHGGELWKSDGTELGTTLVTDVLPGPLGGLPFLQTGITPGLDLAVTLDTGILFAVNDGLHGVELWRAADSAAVLVKDINPMTSASLFSLPSLIDLESVGDELYFTGIDPVHGLSLWVSDGTQDGTRPFKTIDPVGSRFPAELTTVGDHLYFVERAGVGGFLWTTDGTADGTVQLTVGGQVEQLANYGGRLFYSDYFGDNVGQELGSSLGTPASTTLVKDVADGANGSGITDLTPTANALFFVAWDEFGNHGLWKSDGTTSGTIVVKDNILPPNPTYSDFLLPNRLTAVGGTLFFVANDGTGAELWKSDGTPDGTNRVKDIRIGSTGSDPTNLVGVGGRLFFTANDGLHGNELWTSDGTESGTVMVADIRSGSSASQPSSLTEVNGTLFFSANDGQHGVELWKSDGTGAGTLLVKDIRPGGSQSNPVELTSAGECSTSLPMMDNTVPSCGRVTAANWAPNSSPTSNRASPGRTLAA